MSDFQSADHLSESYQQVQAEIDLACGKAQRDRSEITLLAVSKKHPIEAIETVFNLGQRCFGENYVQEGVDKIQALRHLDIQWHFIGPLQSNKSRLVAEHFDWIHTVDRAKIAKRLSEQRPDHLAPLNLLIQVNVSNDPAKSGIQPEDVADLANAINDLSRVTLRGLMCIPAQQTSAELAHDFSTMQTLFNGLKALYPSVDTLSMGMSQDLELAIIHGSSMVRIGTAIFGART